MRAVQTQFETSQSANHRLPADRHKLPNTCVTDTRLMSFAAALSNRALRSLSASNGALQRRLSSSHRGLGAKEGLAYGGLGAKEEAPPRRDPRELGGAVGARA